MLPHSLTYKSSLVISLFYKFLHTESFHTAGAFSCAIFSYTGTNLGRDVTQGQSICLAYRRPQFQSSASIERAGRDPCLKHWEAAASQCRWAHGSIQYKAASYFPMDLQPTVMPIRKAFTTWILLIVETSLNSTPF